MLLHLPVYTFHVQFSRMPSYFLQQFNFKTAMKRGLQYFVRWQVGEERVKKVQSLLNHFGPEKRKTLFQCHQLPRNNSPCLREGEILAEGPAASATGVDKAWEKE